MYLFTQAQKNTEIQNLDQILKIKYSKKLQRNAKIKTIYIKGKLIKM